MKLTVKQLRALVIEEATGNNQQLVKMIRTAMNLASDLSEDEFDKYARCSEALMDALGALGVGKGRF